MFPCLAVEPGCYVAHWKEKIDEVGGVDCHRALHFADEKIINLTIPFEHSVKNGTKMSTWIKSSYRSEDPTAQVNESK